MDRKQDECLKCGARFRIKRYWQHFCSEACRMAWHKKEMQEARTIIAERKREAMSRHG